MDIRELSGAVLQPDANTNTAQGVAIQVVAYVDHDSIHPDALSNRHDEDFEDKEHELFGEEGFEKMVDRVAGLERSLGIFDLGQFTPK